MTTYAATVEAYARILLQQVLTGIAPTAPLQDMLPPEILQRACADPAMRVSDVFPLEAIAQASNDATKIVDNNPPSIDDHKQAVKDIRIKYYEIVCDILSTHPSITQRAYDTAVEVHAYFGLVSLYGYDEFDPSSPVDDMLMLDDLEQTSVDPSTPVGDVFPRETLKQAFVKWYKLFCSMDPSLRALVERRCTGSPTQLSKAFMDDVDTKVHEIILDMLWAWKRRTGLCPTRTN